MLNKKAGGRFADEDRPSPRPCRQRHGLRAAQRLQAVRGCEWVNVQRPTHLLSSFTPRSPPDTRREAAGPRAARRDRCIAVKKASLAGCRARPAAAPRAAAQDTPRINESFDTRRLALVAVELAANARPLTVFKNAQVRARRPLGLGLGRAPAEGEGGQGPEQGQVPEGRAPGAGPASRFVLLFASRRRSTPPARRRGDGVERTPSRGTPCDGVVVGVVLRHRHPVEHRHHVIARRSSA